MPNGSTQIVKRLNAWGALKYYFRTHPTYRYSAEYNESRIEYTDEITVFDYSYSSMNTMSKLSFANDGVYTFMGTSANAIDFMLYDDDFDKINIIQNKSDNGKTSSFSINLTAGTYYLRTNTAQDGSVDIVIDCPPHTYHRYSEWEYYSSNQHIEACACGVRGTIKASHIVRFSDPLTNNKRPCIMCGAMVGYTNPGFGQIIHKIQKVSLNGSYILQNGIIVLVDEDIEAYFAGTLVFYYPDELPEFE